MMAVHGLQPGWILRTQSGYWHWREDDGHIICARSHGPQLKILKFNPVEPKGKQKGCPACIRILQRRKAEKPPEPEPELEPTPQEPEVLQLPQQEQPMNAQPKEEKYYTCAEIGEMLDRPEVSIWKWGKQYPDLKFIPRKGFPDSVLPRFEHYDKITRRKGTRRTKDVSATPAPVANAPAREVAKPESGPYRLTNEQALLAALLGMSQPEFIKLCVEKHCETIIAKVRS